MRKLPAHSRSAALPAPARTPISSEGPVRFVPLVRDRTALLTTGSPWALVLDGVTRSWWYEESGALGVLPAGRLRHVLHPAIDAAELDLLLLTDLAPLVEEAADGYDPTRPTGFSDEAIERWEELGEALGDDRLLLDGALWTDVGDWDWSRASDALEIDPWSSQEEVMAALDDGVGRYQRIVGIAGEAPRRVVGKARFAARLHRLCELSLAALTELAHETLAHFSTADGAADHRAMAVDVQEELEQNPLPYLSFLAETVGGDVLEWTLRALDEVGATRSKPAERGQRPMPWV